MKRFLDKQRYELSDWEKNEIWQRVNGATTAIPRPTGRIRRPVYGLTAAVAVLAVCLVVWQNGRVAEKIMPTGPALIVEPAAPEGGKPEHMTIASGEVQEPTGPSDGTVRQTGAGGDRDQAVMASRPTDSLKDPAASGDTKSVGQNAPVEERRVEAETFEKYAIGSMDDAAAKQAGTVSRAGRLNERDRPAGQEALDLARVAKSRIQPGEAAPAVGPSTGSVTGGTTPPNDEPYELMYFQHTGVNPFVATEDDALSTFAIDVDGASWTLVRNYLERGHLPPAAAVRVEEFVNSFEAGWPEQTEQPLAIHADGAPSRFGSGYHLLRVGLVGQHIDASARKSANLVFVVDVSGSMRQENRLGAVRHSLTLLLDELREGDRVGIVVYGSRGEVRLRPTDISRREEIQAAIDGLVPAGSTNCYEGLKLAYDMARGSYEADVLNRLILCSDGVANNGASTEAEGILELVRGAADEGITLSTVGFGMGNYNDVLMEKLADKGDGNYAYVDRKEEAERVFRENLTGMLQTVARETKVQVEFDPRRVDRWRLLGYENRDIADRDFRNDDVDAGEVGVDHRVTALYEVKLTDVDDGIVPPGSLGTVRLRWEAPAHDTARAGQVTEIEREITAADLAGDFAEADLRLRVQAVVAEFAEILRESYWAKESNLADLVPVADGLAADLPGDAQVQELARLIRLAASLEGE